MLFAWKNPLNQAAIGWKMLLKMLFPMRYKVIFLKGALLILRRLTDFCEADLLFFTSYIPRHHMICAFNRLTQGCWCGQMHWFYCILHILLQLK